MSADNWAQCPRCVADANKADAEREKAIRESYGKVTPEEFVAAVDGYKPTVLDYSLREDCEQGIDKDGLYSVSYWARCSNCRFEFSFEHTATAFVVRDERLTPR